jgi:hypothetical protein
MSIETLQLVADILTINFLFHAAMLAGGSLIAGYHTLRLVAALPAPRKIH